MNKIFFYKFLLVIVLLAVNFNAEAQRRIRFQNFTISNGLSQSSVNAMMQDEKGFIWIGTQDGLNKFDGYTFKVFRNQQNNSATLSNNFIQSICDDGNGNLWIGTDGGGLNIFNKATEKVVRVNLGPDFRFIYGMARCGNDIFVSSENGGIKQVDIKSRIGKLIVSEKELGTGYIQSLYVEKNKYLWIGTGDNGLFVYDLKSKAIHSFKQGENYTNPLADDIIWSITGNGKGDIWVSTNAGLFKIWGSFGAYSHDRLTHIQGNKGSISSNSVRTVFISRTDNIYVGTSGRGFTVISPTPNGRYTYSHHSASEYIPNSLVENNVTSFLEDASGCIWVGTANGISRYDPGKQFFGHISAFYNEPFSLDDKQVWSMLETGDGSYYVGTRGGLNLVSPLTETVLHFKHQGQNRTAANDNSIFSLHLDENSQLWVGAIDGFFKVNIRNGFNVSFEPVPFKPDFDKYGDNRVYRIVEDEDGLMWLATKQGLSIVNRKTKKFWFFNGKNNNDVPIKLSASPIIRCVFIDSKNNKWVSSDDGMLYKITSSVKNDNLVVESFSKYNLFKTKKSNDQIMITSMWEDKRGKIWMGTFGAGLLEYDPHTSKCNFYTEDQGLSNNVVYGVLGDDEGNLWMSTNKGLSKYDPKEKLFRNYEEKDGVQSNEFNTGAYYKNSFGELMFGGINGYNIFNPSSVKINALKPLVAITDISLFNTPLVPGQQDSPLQESATYQNEVFLTHRQNNLTIHYSALHFSNTENNRYKYILEGADEIFNEVGNTRSAHYTKLASGDYLFKVYAYNSDGVMCENPATIAIHIAPPFWATWWFRTIAVLMLLALIYGIWQVRMYTIKSHRLNLAKEVRERTQEVMLQAQKIEEQNKLLEAEKEKVENLLMNVLPKDTAEELKTRGKASARSYRQVTVMFTDFKGFTRQAEKMRPADLVERLDSYFIEFDEIIQKFGLEKIKTIGDSYMCAGGLPIRNKSNPIDTVLGALEIQNCMRRMNAVFSSKNEDPWELRIGINTGEVIAGVIGIKRFAYDIWGSTVNVASRLETSCEPGMINVSGSTFAEIEPFFECTYRGKIATKNTGEIDMYYVHRIKPGLSIDEEGIYPNEKFKKYVDLHLFSSINYKKAERHIMKVLKDRLPDNLYYHGIHHTYDVVEAVERIALLEGITGEEMFVLKSAATYHDAGFVEQYAKNEPIGIRMAKEILPLYGYTAEQVDEVEKLIYATIIPHNPQSHLQEIICDADLDYLGRDDFHQIAETLRMELSERNIVGNKRQWDEMQIKFLTMHKYFTKSAIKMRQVKKEKHIEEIKARLLEKYDDE